MINKEFIELIGKALLENEEEVMAVLKKVLGLGAVGLVGMFIKDQSKRIYNDIKREKHMPTKILKIAGAVIFVGATGVVMFELQQILRNGNKDVLETGQMIGKNIKYKIQNSEEFGLTDLDDIDI